MLAEKIIHDNKDQLRYNCRRGMLELDLLLIPFFDKHYSDLSQDKKLAFIELLKQEDQVLHSWFFSDNIPESSLLQDLVLFIRYNQNNIN